MYKYLESLYDVLSFLIRSFFFVLFYFFIFKRGKNFSSLSNWRKFRFFLFVSSAIAIEVVSFNSIKSSRFIQEHNKNLSNSEKNLLIACEYLTLWQAGQFCRDIAYSYPLGRTSRRWGVHYKELEICDLYIRTRDDGTECYKILDKASNKAKVAQEEAFDFIIEKLISSKMNCQQRVPDLTIAEQFTEINTRFKMVMFKECAVNECIRACTSLLRQPNKKEFFADVPFPSSLHEHKVERILDIAVEIVT